MNRSGIDPPVSRTIGKQLTCSFLPSFLSIYLSIYDVRNQLKPKCYLIYNLTHDDLKIINYKKSIKKKNYKKKTG